MDDTMERVPEGFLRQYEEQLAAPSFSVDDLVAGGRRRVRRRRAAVVTGVATLVVAVGGLLAGGTLSMGDGREGLLPAGTGGTSSSATTPSPRGCVTQPETCVTVVAAWSREVAHSTATVGTESADAYEAGSVVIGQRVAKERGADVHLWVVVSPSDTDGAGMTSPTGESLALPGVDLQVRRSATAAGGNWIATYDVRAQGGRAVQVGVNVAGQRSGADVRAPAWWTEANVADLLTRLYGTEEAGAGRDATGTGAGAGTATGSATGTAPR